MVRVVPTAAIAADWFGGGAEFEIEAGNLFQLAEALDRRSPGFAGVAGIAISFAVDGALAEDWTAPLPAGSEVLLVPRIGGG